MHKIIIEVSLLKIESKEVLMNHYDYLNNSSNLHLNQFILKRKTLRRCQWEEMQYLLDTYTY